MQRTECACIVYQRKMSCWCLNHLILVNLTLVII